MSPVEPNGPIEMRIETAQPGAERMTIHISAGFADEVANAFEDTGGHVTRDIIELSAPDVAQSVLEVAGPIVASGTAIASILKQWFHRNDGRKVTLTFNGESISLEGMSINEMARIIESAHARWDNQWREQFPERFPGIEE
jgi:hypothetical protein